jgi:hypothetical protein
VQTTVLRVNASSPAYLHQLLLRDDGKWTILCLCLDAKAWVLSDGKQ